MVSRRTQYSPMVCGLWPCLSVVLIALVCAQCRHAQKPQTNSGAIVTTTSATPGVVAVDVAPTRAVPTSAEEQAAADDMDTLQKRIIALQQQQGLNPNDAKIFQALAQAHFYLADEHLAMRLPFDPQAQLEAYIRGILAGERALALSSDAFTSQLQAGASIETALSALDANHYAQTFWYAQNLNAFALRRGVPTLLLYQKRLQTLFTLLAKWDPDAFFGGAQRLEGRFLTQAPAIAGGNFLHGRVVLEQALTRAPNYFANAVALAQFWAVPAHDKEKFVELLQAVRLESTQTPEFPQDEQRMAKRHADWLLAHTDTFF